jgi:uncharacterized membrane protein
VTLIIEENKGWFVVCTLVFTVFLVSIVAVAYASTSNSSLNEHADILEKVATYYLAGTMAVNGLALIKLFTMLFNLKTRITIMEQKCIASQEAKLIYSGMERREEGRRQGRTPHTMLVEDFPENSQ